MIGSHTPPNTAPESWTRDVLDFWFREMEASHWFEGSDAIDELIRVRFGALHEHLVRNGGQDLLDAQSVLAAVIVLDQFSRNMFRGTARAFAADDVALRLAKQALATHLDAGMTPEQKLFLYLPFQHSEDRGDQAISVELNRATARAGLDPVRRGTQGHHRSLRPLSAPQRRARSCIHAGGASISAATRLSLLIPARDRPPCVPARVP